MKAILVGRHVGAAIPDIEVIEQRAVTWPATSAECTPLLRALLADAARQNVVILFQAVPGQLTAALVENDRYRQAGGRDPWLVRPPAEAELGVAIGIIVSKPGARPAGVYHEFAFGDFADARDARVAVAFVNPNARIDVISPACFGVTVDPPMKFEFSHIEWLL